MITFIKQKDELPNYESLYLQEPNTDKMLTNCRILSKDKKQRIDTSEIQKRFRWQGSMPQAIRDTNLNIKNDPRNVFRSRKNSCNNSMLSTQRADIQNITQDQINIVKNSDFSNSFYVRKPSSSHGTTVVMTQIQNSPERKVEEKYYLQQISVHNSQVKGTSVPGKRQTVTESDEPNNKNIAIKYIGVHNDVIGILTRKVPISIEREKLSLYLKNKDSRKCKSRQSTRQSTSPGDNTFYSNPQFTYQDFIGNNSQNPKQQHFELKSQNKVSTAEPGKRKVSLKEYEEFVSNMTNQLKNQETDQKKQVFSSLLNPLNNQNFNNFLIGSHNISSNDSTPMQTKLTPNQKRVAFDQSLRQSTEYGAAPLNQNFMSAVAYSQQKRCTTESSNSKSPMNRLTNTDFKNNLNLQPITPQKLNYVLQEQQHHMNQSDMAIDHMQFRTRRAMSSQAKRLESNEKDQILKQIQKIQNQKYKEYIQDNVNNYQQMQKTFQNQTPNTNVSAVQSNQQSQISSPKYYSFKRHNNQENIQIPESPNPQKYDTYVINKYSISKRLKPVIKNKDKISKYQNISNVQVEWVNQEKKVTYF